MDSAPVRLDVSETPPDDELLARKQSSMLERLAAKDAQRTEDALKKRSDVAEGAAPGESVQQFLDFFRIHTEEVEKRLELLSGQGEGEVSTSELDQLAAEIQSLEKSVSDAVYFLPSYEVRASQGALIQMRGRLEAFRAKIVPKRKFSFGAKKKEKEPTSKSKFPPEEGGDDKRSVRAENGKGGTEGQGEGTNFQGGPGIRGKKGEIVVEQVREGEFTLSHLEDCSIYIVGMLRALYIDHVKSCRVFSGPVTGAVHIEEVSDSILILASHQIRIHHTSQTDFYLRVRSRPIVEHTSAVRFAPYAFQYDGLEEHLETSGLLKDSGDWARVDDFRWLRATQSPNWCTLPETERLSQQHLPKNENGKHST